MRDKDIRMSEYRRQIENHTHASSPLQAARLAFTGIAGFVLTCILFNQLVTASFWSPHLGTYTNRLTALKQHADQVNSIIIGSSHVQYGINPVQFDSETFRLGGSTTSFQLAVRSLTTIWMLQALDDLQLIGLPNLRQVLIEPRVYPVSDLDTKTVWKNAMTLRSRYASNPQRTLEAARLLWSSEVGPRRKIIQSAHLAHNMTLHMANLGVLPDINISKPTETKAIADAWKNRGGTSWSRTVQRPQRTYHPVDADAGYRVLSVREVAYLNETSARVRELGADPLFVFVPGRDEPGLRKATRAALRLHQPETPIMGDRDFTQSSKPYSDSSLWRDSDHLNEAGARLFTAELARQWINLQAKKD